MIFWKHVIKLIKINVTVTCHEYRAISDCLFASRTGEILSSESYNTRRSLQKITSNYQMDYYDVTLSSQW